MAGRRGAKSGARAAQAYDGLVREQLADLQRARIIGAMFQVAAERGAGSVSVAHVVERAGVSRRTFYELFSDRDDCLLAAFEQALALAAERVLPAYEAGGSWRERIRAGLVALLRFLDEQPSIGRVLLVESLSGSPRVLERRAGVIARLTDAVEHGRDEQKGVSAPPLTSEGIVGGVLSILVGRLTERPRAALLALTNQLMSTIVLPYLGAAAARRELDRPVPPLVRPADDGEPLADPFKDVGMRLTYRTVCVLTAVAEHPGASNRQIGTSAGVTDQGQISKLLARLKRIGLVTNTEADPGKGAPNSWSLTAKGRRITDGFGPHTPTQR